MPKRFLHRLLCWFPLRLQFNRWIRLRKPGNLGNLIACEEFRGFLFDLAAISRRTGESTEPADFYFRPRVSRRQRERLMASPIPTSADGSTQLRMVALTPSVPNMPNADAGFRRSSGVRDRSHGHLLKRRKCRQKSHSSSWIPEISAWRTSSKKPNNRFVLRWRGSQLVVIRGTVAWNDVRDGHLTPRWKSVALKSESTSLYRFGFAAYLDIVLENALSEIRGSQFGNWLWVLDAFDATVDCRRFTSGSSIV